MLLLPQLPEDVLYLILSYLDCTSLSRLSQVSSGMRRLLSRDAVWRNVAKEFLNSGITRSGYDMYPDIQLKQRLRTSQNWSEGLCRREILLRWRPKLLPWLQLDGDTLFVSQAADIRAHRLRRASGRLQPRPWQVYRGHRGDVCRFVCSPSHLLSGGSDGGILVHSRSTRLCLELQGHQQEVHCLDSRGQLIVSGSRDRTVRVWSFSSPSPRETLFMSDRVWSVAISPALSSFVTGTACCEDSAPLQLWDTERLQSVGLGSGFRRGAGVLDLVFESPSQILSCGYDTFIRLWDVRVSTRKCVMEWEEPHDSALYCLQTDRNHMIASGSSYYGVVRLWDRRQAACLQVFQLGSDSASSPVYCLRFSSSHLYAALASELHALDFSRSPAPSPGRSPAPSQDYSPAPSQGT